MNEEEKQEIKELINLLYNNHISQYGKRKLENYIKELQKGLDKKDICLKACEDNLIKERQLRIKQDKVINLMAKDRAEIGEPKVSKETIIYYYFKKVEEENE